jgi:hypothetical protein
MQSHATETEVARRVSFSAWQAARPRYRLAHSRFSPCEREETLMPNDRAATTPTPPPQTLLQLIGETLRRHGDAVLPGTNAEAAARAWLDAGFTDAEEVEEWLAARCFDPQHAQTLDAAGVTPEQAALRTRAGRADYEETVGGKFSRGDLTLEEARRIITSDFWNS